MAACWNEAAVRDWRSDDGRTEVYFRKPADIGVMTPDWATPKIGRPVRTGQ